MLYEADFALTCLLMLFHRAGEAGLGNRSSGPGRHSGTLSRRGLERGPSIIQGGMGTPLIISGALNESPAKVDRSVKEADVSPSGRS